MYYYYYYYVLYCDCMPAIPAVPHNYFFCGCSGLDPALNFKIVFRYWSIFEPVPLRWLSPKIFTLWVVLVPVELFTSSFFLIVGFQSPLYISLQFVIFGIFIPFRCWIDVSFAVFVVCFLCTCSVCSPFDSALLACRLFSGVNLYVVMMY